MDLLGSWVDAAHDLKIYNDDDKCEFLIDLYRKYMKGSVNIYFLLLLKIVPIYLLDIDSSTDC